MFNITWNRTAWRTTKIVFAIVIILLLLSSNPVEAQTNTEEAGECPDYPVYLSEEYLRDFSSWYDPSCEISPVCNYSAPVVTNPDSAADFEIPDEYREVFERAAEEHDVDWLLIATVHKIEQGGNAFQLPIPAVWPESPTGAEGPFQFIDSTWNSYKVDANNDGVEDINNLEDAAFAAASFLKSLGASSNLSLGALEDVEFQLPDADTDHRSIARVFKSYNAGPATWRNPSNGLWTRPAGVWGNRKQDEINGYITKGLETYEALGGGGFVSCNDGELPQLGEVIVGDTSNVPCQGTSDEGSVVTGYSGGQAYQIRVCNVEGMVVNSQISGAIRLLVDNSEAAGITLRGGGFRTMDGQIAVRRSNCGTSNFAIYEASPGSCKPPTARPGYSNHQMGLAIDFTCNDLGIINLSSRPGTRVCWDWLVANAADYGLKNLPSENWHWSTTGG